MWGQADRGNGYGSAHLFWRDAATGLDDGHQAACGHNPTKHNGQARDVTFRPAPDDAARCSKCAAKTYLLERTYYPLGQHPSDVVADEAAMARPLVGEHLLREPLR